MKADSRKVLLLTQYLHFGGLERMVFNLAAGLKAGGEWTPEVFAYDRLPGAASENDLGPAFAAAGISATTSVKPRGFSPRTVLAIRRILSDGGIGVIHTHDLGPLIYGACAKRMSLGRVRLIHTQHSFVHLNDRPANRLYQSFFARFADEIAAVSDDVRRTYAGLGVSEDKLRVVPNGASFPERGPGGASEKARSREAALGALDAPARAALEPFLGGRWLLYMARLQKTKGQDHALELWARLSPAARGKSVLLFVGPESGAGELERLRSGIAAAPDASRILYLGTARRPELWLAAADLSLSCSEFEGMPLGPVEAAGAGLPLVLSRIPGHEFLKEWSAQYALSEPAEGARLIERIIGEIEAGPDGSFKRTWEKAGELRARFSRERMCGDYARLYRGEKRP